ncbi:MAG TPA: PAS domain-containing protein [Brevundimonas sp.]|jgi:hypothetical protein
MFHSGTQTLIDHWTALPEARRVPARADFQPMTFGPLTPKLFIVEREGARMRLAGGWVERLHGRVLRGADWLSVWSEASRPMVTAAMIQAFREARPVVLSADAAGLAGVIEIVIAPLRNSDGLADRLVGLYQAVSPLDRRADDVGPLTARLSVGVGGTSRAPLSLAAVDGRRIA